jgi:hypothetical protein
VQKEHVTKAQEMGFQAAGCQQETVAASVLLGEIHWDGGHPREALAAFRTAAMVLTQQGLRTQQAATVRFNFVDPC